MFEEKTYKRCGCKGPLFHRRGANKGKPVLDVNGEQKIGILGTGCPDLAKKGHGTWYFFIELPEDANGERQRVRRGGHRTQELAAKACQKVWEQHQAGLDVLVSESVGDYLNRWADAKGDVKVTTSTKYKEHIRLHINPFIGRVDRKELRKSHIEGMFTSIQERNVEILLHREYVAMLAADCEQKRQAWRAATRENRPVLRASWHEARELLAVERKKMRRVTDPPTQHRILATLSSALQDAVRAEEVSKNWAQLVKLPSSKPPKPLLWTPARVARWRETGEIPGKVMVWTPQLTGQFLDTYVDDELFDLWHFMALRGPRRGEACALPWTEVDLDEMTVTISRQVVAFASKLLNTTPKTDDERTIALDSENGRLLELRKERQDAQRAKLGKAWKDSGLVFCKDDGTGYHPDHLTYRFKKMVADADLSPSPSTACDTARPASPSPVVPNRRRSRSSWATAASRSPWTPTPTSSRSTPRPGPNPHSPSCRAPAAPHRSRSRARRPLPPPQRPPRTLRLQCPTPSCAPPAAGSQLFAAPGRSGQRRQRSRPWPGSPAGGTRRVRRQWSTAQSATAFDVSPPDSRGVPTAAMSPNCPHRG